MRFETLLADLSISAMSKIFFLAQKSLSVYHVWDDMPTNTVTCMRYAYMSKATMVRAFGQCHLQISRGGGVLQFELSASTGRMFRRSSYR